MAATDRLQIVRDCYGAYESGDGQVVETHLSGDLTFYSPADIGIDRTRYFERCWPNSDLIDTVELRRLVEAGDEVLVTFEITNGRKAVWQHRGPHVRRRQDPHGGGLLRLGR